MLLIEQLTSDSKQKQVLLLDDGTTISLTIEYKPLQFGWFITELSRLDFVIQGMRICTSPNLLQQFCNQIPFGLACYTSGNAEPTLQEDFAPGGRSQLYILTEAEVIALTAAFRG